LKRRLLLFLTAILAVLPGCNSRSYSSGDRVLVAKFLYDTDLRPPERFDVVVFKYPVKPLEKNIPKNYIKRLLGLPGEILAIFFGRLYRMPAPPPGAPPYYDDSDKDPLTLWEAPGGFHSNDERSKALFNAGKFEIIRKPPDVLLAMRRIVYDNDFPAKDLTGSAWQRWQPAADSAWKSGKEHSFACQAATKDNVDWLRYRHILRPNQGDPPVGTRKPELITDFMSYNSFWSERVDERGRPLQGDTNMTPNPDWAGDLMLECDLKVDKAEGEFWMELSKGINRYRARWDLATGSCTLFKQGLDQAAVALETKSTRLKGPGSYFVRMANIDARLTVWVDRELPFGHGFEYPPPEVRGPGETVLNLNDDALHARRGPTQNDLEPASLGSKGGSMEVRHIKLWRDTYYTQNATSNPSSDLGPPADWSDPNTWDIFKTMPVKTMYVQPGHYLCLGDNSQQSSDSRAWGLVPQRLMLGRALMVYYPFNRAGPIR
jgi:signal peptidase I